MIAPDMQPPGSSLAPTSHTRPLRLVPIIILARLLFIQPILASLAATQTIGADSNLHQPLLLDPYISCASEPSEAETAEQLQIQHQHHQQQLLLKHKTQSIQSASEWIPNPGAPYASDANSNLFAPSEQSQASLGQSQSVSDGSRLYENENIPHFRPDKELLTYNIAHKVCTENRGCDRMASLNNTYLNYCTRYSLENLISSDELMAIMHNDSENCMNTLEQFILLDEKVDQDYRQFNELLHRYNCHNGYSFIWTCDDCKKAYRDWLCATFLPYYTKGQRVKPCISFCERVEQRCPYLHPITKEQYGGQPVFICRDPNIPFIPEITADIIFSEPYHCYDLCHLSNDKEELSKDSLSKYELGKCPKNVCLLSQARGGAECKV